MELSDGLPKIILTLQHLNDFKLVSRNIDLNIAWIVQKF